MWFLGLEMDLSPAVAAGQNDTSMGPTVHIPTNMNFISSYSFTLSIVPLVLYDLNCAGTCYYLSEQNSRHSKQAQQNAILYKANNFFTMMHRNISVV